VTAPPAVSTRPGAIAVTRERSQIVAPARSAAAARPSASCIGCTRAQCGVKRAPMAPSTAIRARVCSAVSSTLSDSVIPQRRSSAISARWRSSSSGVWATCSEPPLRYAQAMPSRATTSPIASTVAWIARSWASTASRPAFAAQRSREPASSPTTQPPLRPDAPKPTVSASSTTTSSAGAARWSS
jgi:hypothetical protein